MESGFEHHDFDEDVEPKRTDVSVLRILAHWIADHAGTDPISGIVIDRDFVLVDAPTMSAHRVG